jgi:uncharacterized protein
MFRKPRTIAAGVMFVAGALWTSNALHGAAMTVADAAMNGDREMVRMLIKQGADVNAAQGDGVTALHWAAMKGDAELANTLIIAGASVRAATRLGAYTPLHMAADLGSAPVVAALVKGGADVNATTATGTTPLMLAATSGNTEAIKALLDNGAEVNARELDRGHTALMFAAAGNRAGAVTLLLARGADPAIATTVVPLAALSADGSNPDGAICPATARAARVATRAPRPRLLPQHDGLASIGITC